MSKTKLIESIAGIKGCTKKEAEDIIKTFTGAAEEVLLSGEPISLIGFGKFEVRQNAEKKGRNPQTGKEITIPAKKVVKFKTGKTLADKIA